MALANHEWSCRGGVLKCINTSTGFEVGSGLSESGLNACGIRLPWCAFAPDSKGRQIPQMGNWRGNSRYRNFDVAFFGGIPNNMGENRFRNFNAVIPATGEQTIIVDESVITPSSIVKEAPKVVRKNIVPFTATLAGALLGYYVFDKFFKFSYSNYVGLVAGGAIGYSVSNSKM